MRKFGPGDQFSPAVNTPAPNGHLEPQVLERVKAEYPPALKSLEDAYSRVRATGTSTVIIPAKPPVEERIIESKFSIAVDGMNQCVARHTTDRSPSRTGARDEVDCVNTNYSFTLTRNGSEVPYLLNGFATERNRDTIGEIGTTGRNYLFAPFSIESHSILHLCADPKFRFIDAESINEDSRNSIKIEFESTDPKAPIVAGTLWVNPSEGWVLHKAEYFVHPSRKRLFRSSIEYTPSNSGRPALKVVAILEPSQLRREYVFDSVLFEKSPESDFHLPAFGLPELSNKPGADPSRNHAGLWFIGLGVVSLVVALGFRYLARRNRV